jgi:hypothetical protein
VLICDAWALIPEPRAERACMSSTYCHSRDHGDEHSREAKERPNNEMERTKSALRPRTAAFAAHLGRSAHR